MNTDNAHDYDHEDVRALADETAAALGEPAPTGMTIFWQHDGPHIGVRVDHLHALLDATYAAPERGDSRQAGQRNQTRARNTTVHTRPITST